MRTDNPRQGLLRGTPPPPPPRFAFLWYDPRVSRRESEAVVVR